MAVVRLYTGYGFLPIKLTHCVLLQQTAQLIKNLIKYCLKVIDDYRTLEQYYNLKLS